MSMESRESSAFWILYEQTTVNVAYEKASKAPATEQLSPGLVLSRGPSPGLISSGIIGEAEKVGQPSTDYPFTRKDVSPIVFRC